MATNYAVPAGEFIAEWLEENDMRAAELASRLKVSRKHVSQLLAGKVALTHDIADRLEIVTNVPARVWMNYESLYRVDAARLRRNSAIRERFDDISKFPLDYLRSRDVITAPREHRGETGRQLLTFFKVSDVDTLLAQPQMLAAFRQSTAHTVDEYAVATWIQYGKLKAREARDSGLLDFDEAALRAMLNELRGLTIKDVDVFAREMVELPARAGVVVVLDRGPAGTRCSGVTHWVGNTPVIQLTDRGKKNDQLWFTYFHELGHVLLHPHNKPFVECESESEGTREDEANQFARDLLIPPHAWERRPRGKNIQAVEQFAADLQIHPGIVIGRIHRETKVYNWGHKLKQSLELVED